MIAREFAAPESLLVVEYFYGVAFTWRHADLGPIARSLNSRMMAELGGVLFRAYVEGGWTVAEAHEELRCVRGRVRGAYLTGRTLVDHVNPVARASAHVVVVNRDDHILMQLRDHDTGTKPVSSPNMWSTPGGKVEPGETPYEAALRELQEETGLRVDQLVGGRLVPIGSFLEIRPGERVRRHLYRADTHATNNDVTCGEGQAMVFLPPEQIRRLPLTLVAIEALSVHLYADARA